MWMVIKNQEGWRREMCLRGTGFRATACSHGAQSLVSELQDCISRMCIRVGGHSMCRGWEQPQVLVLGFLPCLRQDLIARHFRCHVNQLLELLLSLPLIPLQELWDYKCVPPCLALYEVLILVLMACVTSTLPTEPEVWCWLGIVGPVMHCCGTLLCTTGWLWHIWHIWPLPAGSWRSALSMVYSGKCFQTLLDVPRRAKSPPLRAICWRAPPWDAGGPVVSTEGHYTSTHWQMSLHPEEKILLS